MGVSARVQAWLQPIPGGAPGGSNARFDPRHEAIRGQVAELDSPSGRAVDWKQVVAQGGEILGQVSKDLLIAAYVAHGLFQLEGAPGLTEGLDLLTGLLSQYWDSAFPEVARIKGRAAALTWFVERTAQPLGVMPPPARATLVALEEANKAFSKEVRARFTDPAPPLSPLGDAITRVLLSAPAEAAPPAAPPAAVPLVAAGPAPSAPVPPPVTSAPPASTPSPAPAGERALVDLEAKVEPLLQPIRADAPAGDNAKFDPRHEQVRAQIARLDSPSGGAIDWGLVRREATDLLKEASKDLLIASYLTWALFELDGWPGLTQGFLLLEGLHARYWANAFPEVTRLKGRANALTWLFERVERNLSAATPKLEDGPRIEALTTAFTRLSKQARERYEGQGPALQGVKDGLTRLALAVPKPAPPSPQAPAAPPPSAPVGAAPGPAPAQAVALGGAPPPPSDPAQVQAFLRDTGNAMVAAGKALRAANSADPEAYRLLRLGLWTPILQLPATGPNGRTTVPPPAPAVVAKLEPLRNNGKWVALLDEAESLVPQARFSLELQRMVAQALEGLGESHRAARLALEHELVHFLARHPGVKELKFADGTQAAGPETRAWLDRLGGGQGGGPAVGAAEGPEVDQARTAAAAHVKEGRLGPALQHLEVAARGAAGHAAFLLRLEAAQLAFGAGRIAAAAALYEALGREAEAHDLDRWDPNLAKTYLSAHLACLRAQRGKDGGGVVQEKTDLLYSRLARLDPILALEQA